jgi:1-acyl-sn-glycerol-3-phosphate acyltransferase
MYIATTLVGYLLAGILLLMILLLVFIQSLANNQHIFDRLIKALCRLIPLGFGVRIRVRGEEGVPREESAIFIANHVNILDPLILYGHIPRFVRGVELETHFRWPVWGALVRRLGNIPISHQNTRSALESLKEASERIKDGTSIVIFPEGHRTRDGKLQTFHSGPFLLAQTAGVPIQPIALKGLWERKTVHSIFIKPGEVEFIYGTPFGSGEIAEKSVRTLRKEAALRMAGMLLDGPEQTSQQ